MICMFHLHETSSVSNDSEINKILTMSQYVCDNLIRKTHSTEPPASFTDWQVVQCVTNMSNLT